MSSHRSISPSSPSNTKPRAEIVSGAPSFREKAIALSDDFFAKFFRHSLASATGGRGHGVMLLKKNKAMANIDYYATRLSVTPLPNPRSCSANNPFWSTRPKSQHATEPLPSCVDAAGSSFVRRHDLDGKMSPPRPKFVLSQSLARSTRVVHAVLGLTLVAGRDS